MSQGDSYHLKFGPDAGAHVDAYLEYRRIVGDDDGGVMMSPQDFEEYQKRVLPMRLKNRLYVSWYSPPTGIDCKMVGPETPCFCTHRYKQHKTDFEHLPEARPILLPCRVRGCRCSSYNYVPLNGSQPIRCNCKHYADEHSETNLLRCKKSGCKCAGFRSSYTCGCGEPAYRHEMVIETREERENRGRPVGQEGVPYQAMGGLTGFSSLAEGYMRMDPSGKAVPSKAFLNQPIANDDHPYLRSNLQEIDMVKRTQGLRISDREKQELQSQMRKPGESELDFYERRYQERQKNSKVYKPAIKSRPDQKKY